MWTCKCGRSNPGNAPCECKVVKVDKVTDDRQLANYWSKRDSYNPVVKKNAHVYDTTSEEKLAYYKRKRDMEESIRGTDTLLDDPNFDRSLKASRDRLEQAIAIASQAALRLIKTGLTVDNVEMLAKVSNTYRTLANTVETKDPSEMSEEDLRKQASK